ncbi:MAG: TA system VapC family ribonuclease toxin [Fibrobacteria bacterium]
MLVASILPSHPHYGRAREWIKSLASSDRIGLCRWTQLAFLRLMTTEAILKEDVRTNAQALAIWETIASQSRCEFLSGEPAGFESKWLRLANSTKPSPKIWMDALLSAFAMGYGFRLVTFDRGFETYRKAGLDLLLLS